MLGTSTYDTINLIALLSFCYMLGFNVKPLVGDID